MADASSVAPVWQLLGTMVTVLGAIAVAVIANRSPARKALDEKTVASHSDMVRIHADIIELNESLRGIKVLLLDYWQWNRDREQAARERHEWLKEKFK